MSPLRLRKRTEKIRVLNFIVSIIAFQFKDRNKIRNTQHGWIRCIFYLSIL